MAEDEVAGVLERAHRHVAQAVQQSADDLTHVEQLRLRALRKRAAIESRLKTAVQSQISDVYEGMDLLQRCLRDLDSVQTSVDESEHLLGTCEELIHHAAQARVLSDSRNRMRSTMEQLDQIFNVPDDVQELENMLKEDPPNLLLAHQKLMHLERCMEHVQSKIKNTSVRPSDARAIDEYFQGVRVVSAKLQQHVFFVAHDPLALVKTDPALLVSALRIIMREEKLDREAAPNTPNRPKNLKEKYMEKLGLQIESSFDSKLFAQGSVYRFLEAFRSFYFTDLIVAQQRLPECFPPEIDIFNFYLNHYHDRLCFMTEQLRAHADVSPNDIMLLLNWVPEYKQDMSTQLGIEVSRFSQQLLGVEQDDLRDTYLEMLKSKLSEWVANLVASDVRVWKGIPRHKGPSPPGNMKREDSGAGEQSAHEEGQAGGVEGEAVEEEEEEEEDRSEPPLKANGLYVTDTPVILFQMIERQIDVAFQRGGGGLFAAQVLEECYRAIKEFHQGYESALSEVQAEYTGEEAKPHPRYLVEHMMAVVNNFHRSRNYMSQVLTKIEAHYPRHAPEYMRAESQVHEELDPGFSQLATRGVGLLLELMFVDLNHIYADLFVLKWLRSRKALKRILATLEDYCTDFQEHLNPRHFHLLMTNVYKRTVIQYLRALMTKRYRPKDEQDRETFARCFREELEMLRDFFQQFDIVTDSTGRDPTMALVYIHQMLDVSPGVIKMSFLKMRSEFPGFTHHHLETILNIRDDFSSKEARTFIRDTVIGKKKGKGDPPEPTEQDVQDSSFFVHVPVSTSTNFAVRD
ncbi:hypothetical protein PTSG_03829 [Salpingoeca rosetta]|uniref:Uncharacterized protein n=1 Tax=Salpingoeca rosetta (strain ATCC 50818 / BSB-021) TaxID=946362 RepID=F2U5I2_SALR5|nr:uncharacterized protein PTSG_03829 [Salpingoeca rosetta]EGD83198.1 hypothetical protein PTSG_03829 [Salpingoeca rosetta]|eukprot:XP_004995562.1 hypothetical protein PTSG_03829 [Salpingoeca rosetta]